MPRIAGRLDPIKIEPLAARRKWDFKRAAASVAQALLHEALQRDQVRSRAGHVRAETPSTWILIDWEIPAFLWRVVTIYRYDQNLAVTWVWPANKPRPPGWPVNGAVHLTDVAVAISDIDRVWPVHQDGRSQSRISLTKLQAFVRSYADGSKTEAECRQAAQEHFGEPIPQKSYWRRAWREIPAAQKLPRGKRKSVK